MEKRTQLDGISVLGGKHLSDNRVLTVDSPPIVLPERLKHYKRLLQGLAFYRGARSKDYKYVWKSNGIESLYKVGDFECEENNIIKKFPSIARSMHDKMLEFYLG